MMISRKAIPLLVLALLAFAQALPVHSQSGIIVNSADTVRQEGVSLDPGLGSVTGSVSPRIVLQYANTKREERIVPPPGALQTLFGQMTPRIVLQYANTKREEHIAAPPADLHSIFGQVTPRIALQHANTSRQMTLTYPRALIGDAIAPLIGGLSVRKSGNGVNFSWTTDEFADSAVLLGVQSGNYTRTVRDSFFLKQHELTVTALAPWTTYYFQVRSADLSGNIGTSPEGRIQAQSFLFLPLTTRDH